jgi:hypothetical protein
MAIKRHELMETSVLQLSALVKARRNLNKEILRLQRLLYYGATHIPRGNVETRPLGVTDAIRTVFRYYPMWLSPVLIRDLLPTIGFDFSHYKHPLTSIHAILRRLVASGEVIQKTGEPRVGRAYIWADFLARDPNT